jgi:hypothetical protein
MSYSLLAAENYAYFRTFMIASTAGVVSLFPLLFTPAGMLALFNVCLVKLTLVKNKSSRFYTRFCGRSSSSGPCKSDYTSQSPLDSVLA